MYQNQAVIVGQHLSIEGGKLTLANDTVVDATLSGVHIVARNGAKLKLSALSTLDECLVDCGAVEVAGTFSGHIKAEGDVEIADSASIAGVIELAGRLSLGGEASMDDVRLKRFTPRIQAEVVDEQGQPIQPTEEPLAA